MKRAFDAHLDMLQTSVRQLNMASASFFAKNANAHLVNALAQVEATSHVKEIANGLVSKAAQLATLIGSFPPIDAEEEKKTMLDQIAQLRAELQRCEPSQTARILGSE